MMRNMRTLKQTTRNLIQSEGCAAAVPFPRTSHPDNGGRQLCEPRNCNFSIILYQQESRQLPHCTPPVAEARQLFGPNRTNEWDQATQRALFVHSPMDDLISVNIHLNYRFQFSPSRLPCPRRVYLDVRYCLMCT